MSHMNLRRSGVAVALAATTLAIIPAGASGASVAADLRVQTQARTLADVRQLTGTVKLRTDPGATCFGPGTGGTGQLVTVTGPTALGIVQHAAATERRLRPISVTDAFSFGLGICGFGAAKAPSTGFWYLKVNHVASQVGGDQATLKRGDEVLWYLDTDFADPPPAELELRAPAAVRVGAPFTVTVLAYADGGQRTPAVGATVLGQITDANGQVQLTASRSGRVGLQATRGVDIPSNKVRVCVAEELTSCAAQGKRIAGTTGRDRIMGTGRPDTILALAGNDRVNVLGGGRDTVNCGGGRDRVRANRRDRLRNCERVIRG